MREPGEKEGESLERRREREPGEKERVPGEKERAWREGESLERRREPGEKEGAWREGESLENCQAVVNVLHVCFITLTTNNTNVPKLKPSC
nr:hypothetical protein BgiMline_007899 [Biomphalaria glabrata]